LLRQYFLGIVLQPSCCCAILNYYLDERADCTQYKKAENEELCDVCKTKAKVITSASLRSNVSDNFDLTYKAQQYQRSQIRMRALDESKQEALTYKMQLRTLRTLRDRCLLCDYLEGEVHFIDKCESVERAAYDKIKI
jgi:hypothetical protein